MPGPDTNSHDKVISDGPPPPPPPPPPPKQTNTSTVALKTKETPTWFETSQSTSLHADYLEPKTGVYLFYGTLQDPKLLADILQLDQPPTLRPATVTGYECKLWGPYPAATPVGAPGIVIGNAYDVTSVEHARRLAEYETVNYRTEECVIEYKDGQLPGKIQGRIFVFAGDERDLEEGEFDLEAWLKRVGRG